MKNLLALTTLILLFSCNDSNPLKTPNHSSTKNGTAIPTVASIKTASTKMDSLVYTIKTVRKDNGGCMDENEDSPCTEVTYSYPVFKGKYAMLNDSVKPAPNVENAATNFIKEFEEYVKVMDSDYMMGWNMTNDVSVIYNSVQLISISHAYSDYMGGAHGNYGLGLYSLDPKTGKVLELSDLLVPNYEEKLRTIGEKYFRKSVGLTPTINLNESGYWFENNKFLLNENFAVTSKGLWFSYDPYEIAAYAMGSSDLVIPFKDLKDLVKKGSILEGLVNS